MAIDLLILWVVQNTLWFYFMASDFCPNGPQRSFDMLLQMIVKRSVVWMPARRILGSQKLACISRWQRRAKQSNVQRKTALNWCNVNELEYSFYSCFSHVVVLYFRLHSLAEFFADFQQFLLAADIYLEACIPTVNVAVRIRKNIADFFVSSYFHF